MGKLYIKRYQLILGASILLNGIILFAIPSNPIRYLGIITVLFAILYLAKLCYSILAEADDKVCRSRMRDQILKHQYKK